MWLRVVIGTIAAARKITIPVGIVRRVTRRNRNRVRVLRKIVGTTRNAVTRPRVLIGNTAAARRITTPVGTSIVVVRRV